MDEKMFFLWDWDDFSMLCFDVVAQTVFDISTILRPTTEMKVVCCIHCKHTDEVDIVGSTEFRHKQSLLCWFVNIVYRVRATVAIA